MASKIKSPAPHKGKALIQSDKPRVERINYPVFCFKYLHKDYHIDKCTPEEKKKLIEHIVSLSSMTWEQLQLSPRHALGSEKISPQSIKASIPSDYMSEEVNTLLAFRFDGKKPFVGFRNGFIFHVFYIDRDFTLYSH
jgi:hypothetical protein